jgi:hypothetical protein
LFDAENEKTALPIITSKQADRGAAGGRPGFGQHAIIQRPQAIWRDAARKPRPWFTRPAAEPLIGGHIDYMCGNLGTSVARVAAKQSKALALLSRERTALMPELATTDRLTIYPKRPMRESARESKDIEILRNRQEVHRLVLVPLR